MPGITSPICFINGLWRCVSKILPGITPYGSGGWAWFSVSEEQRLDKAIPAATNSDDPSRVCPPCGGDRVAGEGIPHAVEMPYNCLSDGRHARTVLYCSDALDLCPLPGDDPSRVCSPMGWRGWLERGSRMPLKRYTTVADRRHAWAFLHRSDASDICPLPGAVASCQILQASPLHKCPGGHNKEDDI